MRRLGLTAGLIYAKDEAVEYCKARRALTTPKIEADVSPDYQPTSTDEAVRRAPKNLFRVGDSARLGDPLQTKSLSSFAFGSNSFLLAPTLADRVVSCIHDPTDVAG
jgi:hypothetical protein